MPNPSFEEYFIGQDITRIKGIQSDHDYNCTSYWFNALGSVDLYCKQNISHHIEGCMGGGERWAIPPTIFGEIYPFADSSFIGLATWSTSLANPYTPYAYSSREWAGVKLVSPLKRDQCYTFTMYVARAAKTGYNVSSLGAYFTTDSIQGFIDDTSGMYIAPMPFDKDSIQVLQDPAVPIWDTTWVPITGIFRAKGGEQYMYIGNLLKDDQYQLLSNGTYADSMYCKFSCFFIDDVSLYEVEGTCTVGLQEQKKTTLKIYPNPTTGDLYIVNPQDNTLQVEIVSPLGQTVYKQQLPGGNNYLNMNGLANGMYLVRVVDKQALVAIQKLIINK